MVSHSEDRLPASDRICADNGMRSLEIASNVLGRAARGRVHLEVIVGSGFVEQWLGVSCSEALEELLIGSGDAVEQLVAGRP